MIFQTFLLPKSTSESKVVWAKFSWQLKHTHIRKSEYVFSAVLIIFYLWLHLDTHPLHNQTRTVNVRTSCVKLSYCVDTNFELWKPCSVRTFFLVSARHGKQFSLPKAGWKNLMDVESQRTLWQPRTPRQMASSFTWYTKKTGTKYQKSSTHLSVNLISFLKRLD